MGVLIRARAVAAVLAMSAGCYSPSLRDCTVSCADQADCAGDQVCGSDGLCAAPAIAGSCAAAAAPADAAVVLADAAPPPPADAPAMPPTTDAPPPPPTPPDAAATGQLRVQIDGKGSVLVDNLGACTSGSMGHGDCSYEVPLHVPQTARAIATQIDQRFQSWSSDICRSAGATCTFTPTASVTIVAKFDKLP